MSEQYLFKLYELHKSFTLDEIKNNPELSKYQNELYIKRQDNAQKQTSVPDPDLR
jgi:hypothetical protein